MALIRVFSASKKGLSSPQFHFLITPKSHSLIFCKRVSSISSSLLARLIQEHSSNIKAILDSEYNNLTHQSFEFSWDALVTGLRSTSPQKAQLVLEWRLEKLLKDNQRDHVPFSQLIYLYGKLQNIQSAMHVFTSMEALGIKPTSSVFNALIVACLSSGNVITSLSLFEIMDHSQCYKPNSDTYNAFISAYSKLGNFKAMQDWYLAKRACGFSSDLQTYENLISGCVRLKHFDGADKFYEDMTISGVIPNVPILEIMLVGFCERRNLVKVKEFLDFILDGGGKISGPTVQKVVNLYRELKKVEEMEDLVLKLMKSNQDLEVISKMHFGIISMYAMLDRLDDMEYSIGRMLKQGISFKFSDDIEKVICSYFRKAAYDRLDLFLECIRGSYKLTKSTYDLLVAGYRRAGLSEKLDMVISNMKLDGFS